MSSGQATRREFARVQTSQHATLIRFKNAITFPGANPVAFRPRLFHISITSCSSGLGLWPPPPPAQPGVVRTKSRPVPLIRTRTQTSPPALRGSMMLCVIQRSVASSHSRSSLPIFTLTIFGLSVWLAVIYEPSSCRTSGAKARTLRTRCESRFKASRGGMTQGVPPADQGPTSKGFCRSGSRAGTKCEKHSEFFLVS
jgi:hypothetical protein